MRDEPTGTVSDLLVTSLRLQVLLQHFFYGSRMYTREYVQQGTLLRKLDVLIFGGDETVTETHSFTCITDCPQEGAL